MASPRATLILESKLLYSKAKTFANYVGAASVSADKKPALAWILRTHSARPYD
jgi:hypothetical protein